MVFIIIIIILLIVCDVIVYLIRWNFAFSCCLNTVLMEMELEIEEVWLWEKRLKSTGHCRHWGECKYWCSLITKLRNVVANFKITRRFIENKTSSKLEIFPGGTIHRNRHNSWIRKSAINCDISHLSSRLISMGILYQNLMMNRTSSGFQYLWFPIDKSCFI